MTINFFSFKFAGFFFKYSTLISLGADSYCKESACNSPREARERERERERERASERAQRIFRAVEIFCMIL